MVPVFEAGGNPDFDNLFESMPKITVEKRKLSQGSTPEKINPKSVAVILLYEFAHVVVRQECTESPPNLRPVMQDYELTKHIGDAGTLVEQQLLSGRVIGMYKIRDTRLNDVSVPRFTAICGIGPFDIRQIDDQEMLQVVRDEVVPNQFTFTKFHPAPGEEPVAFHVDEDEPIPGPSYVPAEGEIPIKLTCPFYDRPQQ
jgi:hypothetical protein